MGFPSLLGSQQAVAIVDATTSKGFVVADPDNTAHTKGSYTEIHSSLPFTSAWLEIAYTGNLATAGDSLVDIAIGAAASEQIIWANLLTHRQTALNSHRMLVPLFVPIGSRVAARAQCSSANESGVMIGFIFHATTPRGDFGLNQITTYGANTTDTGGAGVDPGASANTKGSYTEISSATTAWARWIAVALGNQKNAAVTTAWFLYDIAIGAATSEQVIVPDVPFIAQSDQDSIQTGFASHPQEVAEGVRIAVRAQCSINDATDRLFDIILYLFS